MAGTTRTARRPPSAPPGSTRRATSRSTRDAEPLARLATAAFANPRRSPPGRRARAGVRGRGRARRRSHAAVPTLVLAPPDRERRRAPVRSIRLNTQVRIAATRRRYDGGRRASASPRYSGPASSGAALRSLQWTNMTSGAAVRRQHRDRAADPCTYDFEVTPAATSMRSRTARSRSSSCSAGRSSTAAPAGCSRSRASVGEGGRPPRAGARSGGRRWTATSRAARGSGSAGPLRPPARLPAPARLLGGRRWTRGRSQRDRGEP